MQQPAQNHWRELISHSASGSSSKPSKAWLKKANTLIEKIGKQQVEENILSWLPILDKKRTENVDYEVLMDSVWGMGDSQYMISEYNTLALRGLLWMLPGIGSAELPAALRNVAELMYKKVYNVGMRNAKIANAAVYALSQIPGDDGVKEIAILRAKTKYPPALKNINRYFEQIAKERNVKPSDLAELAVSDYGLTDVGQYQQTIGNFTADLLCTKVGATQLTWHKDGKAQKSVPAEVKRDHAPELKKIKALAKDLEKATLAFRNRLESTYLDPKDWDVMTWQERYIDHPLGAFIGRRLIWKYTNSDDTFVGIWCDGKIVNNKNEALDLNGVSKVQLWHPIDSTEQEIINWRSWLSRHNITQPIRQAHREVYILTDAERETKDHSVRFAAHIIKQHQFNALAMDRGWSQTLGGSWDGGHETEASRNISQTPYRVVFETSPYGESDLSGHGIYNYVTAGRIRFVDEGSWDPIELESISPGVFSEIMRDVDLFVSVASVGNDPEWEHRANTPYWHDYGFGDLSEMARTRREVVSELLPKLKISKQCKIDNNYLVVEGKLKTYRIHLGSGNILMEPGSTYLCIVSTNKKTGDIFLPFEGDKQLSIILSKALMLADDHKIKDKTILMQIESNTDNDGEY